MPRIINIKPLQTSITFKKGKPLPRIITPIIIIMNVTIMNQESDIETTILKIFRKPLYIKLTVNFTNSTCLFYKNF